MIASTFILSKKHNFTQCKEIIFCLIKENNIFPNSYDDR